MTCGLISRSANSRTLFFNCNCSSFSRKSTAPPAHADAATQQSAPTGLNEPEFRLKHRRWKGKKLPRAAKGENGDKPHEHWRFRDSLCLSQPTGWSGNGGHDALLEPARKIHARLRARCQELAEIPVGARKAWKTSFDNSRPRLVRRMPSPCCSSNPWPASSAIAA